MNHPPHLRTLRQNQYDAMLQDECRLAAELQREGSTRTEALLEAARLVREHGMGVTLGPAPAPST